jgi:hypothetical protein
MKKPIILIVVIISAFKLFAQENTYFSNNEKWSGGFFFGGDQTRGAFNAFQVGDTIISNDTLVKLVKESAQTGSTVNRSFYLAKNDSGHLQISLCNSNFQLTGDTIIIDYSRLDSVTCLRKYTSHTYYQSKEIIQIDTLTFNDVDKKLFKIYDACNYSDNDFVLEGIFGIDDTPFFDGCFEYDYYLNCISISDSTFYPDGEYGKFSGNKKDCNIDNLGIELINNSEIAIFPNPTSYVLNISIPEVELPVSFTLYNSLGKIVIKKELTRNENELNLSEIVKGAYIVLLETNKGLIHKKIIKE